MKVKQLYKIVTENGTKITPREAEGAELINTVRLVADKGYVLYDTVNDTYLSVIDTDNVDQYIEKDKAALTAPEGETTNTDLYEALKRLGVE